MLACMKAGSGSWQLSQLGTRCAASLGGAPVPNIEMSHMTQTLSRLGTLSAPAELVCRLCSFAECPQRRCALPGGCLESTLLYLAPRNVCFGVKFY